ncbi:M20/M25/M40 family metallo-hydrolase [Nocardia vulneris]|uniref:M20/M25/M40 family metallo-hydrolase n=1 Tax=Nocardia vulneris TaxID=1141657 RepID=UPI0030D1EA56
MPSSTTTFPDQLSRLLPEAELVRLAAELTAIPSFTGQETPLAVHVRNALLRNDIHAYHQEVQPGRLQTIARLGPETGTPALLLNGHLDMDPLGHDQPRTPFTARRDGDRLYGAGLHHMKSGLAAILGAAIMVRRSGIALRRPLLLEFVVGELQGGTGTGHALRSGLTADAAVVPEPSSVRRVITRTAGVHKFAVDMPPMDRPADCAVVRDITELLAQVSDFRVEERGLALPYSYCGNDTTHLSRAGIECCLFGPRGAGPDTEHHVLISEMRACADTLALLAARRCG